MNATKTSLPLLIVLAVLGWQPTRCVWATDMVIDSPSGNHSIRFSLLRGLPHYSVSFEDTTILKDSRLSLRLAGEMDRPTYVIEGSRTRSVGTSWRPVVGSKSLYPDAYNECVIQLKQASGKPRKRELTFRAYDEGVAFRYTIPQSTDLTTVAVQAEDTEFQFTDDHFVYWDDYPQAQYSKQRLSTIDPHAIRPLLVETSSHFVAIAEAGSIEHYAPMMLNRNGKHRLVTRFRRGRVSTPHSLETPWRVVMVAKQPGTLVENHYLLQNLSPACALTDTSWIRPGKVWRSKLTTGGAKAIVDYAAANNYQYVHFDAGWYGAERDVKSNPLTYIDDIDLPEVVRYAKDSDIGLICYINKIAMSQYDLDTTFRTYQQWGIRGVKMGFVDWQSQDDMRFLYSAIRKAAKYHLVVDIHDNFRLTGIERMYPHLLTVEGIRGNEETPERGNPPQNVLTTAFARMIAGAGDYTPCYLNGRVVSRSFQLALGVVFYSPLQYLHWYDQADQYAGRTFPELEFWKAMPTSWDDSKVVLGSIGRYITVARRKGDAWFVGTIVNEACKLEIPLNFLGPGNYLAKVYAEAPQNKKKVIIETYNVTSQTQLKTSISDGSGHAIWIVPATSK